MFAEYEHVGVNAINAVIRPILITPPPVGERSIVMSMSVCVSVCLRVCLSVRDNIFEIARPIFDNFFVHGGGSASGGVVVSYIFPVLWMTS